MLLRLTKIIISLRVSSFLLLILIMDNKYKEGPYVVDNMQNLQVSESERIIDSLMAVSTVSVAQLGNQHGGYAVSVFCTQVKDTALCSHALTLSQNGAYPQTTVTVTLTLNSGAYPARLCFPQTERELLLARFFLGFAVDWDLVRLTLLSGLVTNTGMVNCYLEWAVRKFIAAGSVSLALLLIVVSK
jgi:hypothetical protein